VLTTSGSADVTIGPVVSAPASVAGSYATRPRLRIGIPVAGDERVALLAPARAMKTEQRLAVSDDGGTVTAAEVGQPIRATFSATDGVVPFAASEWSAGPASARAWPLPLRFRYVSTPLWWSQPHARSARGSLSAHAEVGAASFAGMIPAPADRGFAAPAVRETARKPGAIDFGSAAGPASAAPPAYIAMTSAGAAGAVPATAAARARADSVEMSIVAAIPPAPPPLEAMASPSPAAGEAPRARRTGAHAPQPRHEEAHDVAGHSKIEGSVDAIAQRIYHRIRRRLQSDRERFGG
jgi:hypothetical protein